MSVFLNLAFYKMFSHISFIDIWLFSSYFPNGCRLFLSFRQGLPCDAKHMYAKRKVIRCTTIRCDREKRRKKYIYISQKCVSDKVSDQGGFLSPRAICESGAHADPPSPLTLTPSHPLTFILRSLVCSFAEARCTLWRFILKRNGMLFTTYSHWNSILSTLDKVAPIPEWIYSQRFPYDRFMLQMLSVNYFLYFSYFESTLCTRSLSFVDFDRLSLSWKWT